MRLLVLLGAFALLSCARESDEARKDYEMIEQAGGSPVELCEASKRVAAAYLKERNEADYRLYKGKSDAQCMLTRTGG